MAESWAIVVAAQGQTDEGRYVLDFANKAKSFYDYVKKEDGCDGATLTADAADVNLEATLLALPFRFQPPGEVVHGQYGKVRHAGNHLLSTAGVTDAKFVPIDCTGHIDKTSRCSPLR